VFFVFVFFSFQAKIGERLMLDVCLLDAAKVPPSQFQRRKGSIYSTPSSRDSQHNNTERDKAYHEKLKEKV